ncbi:MAG: hypothetical protein ACOYM0_01110 [Bacteroidales bacterium]
MKPFKIKFGFFGLMFKTKAEKEKLRLEMIKAQRFETDSPVIDDTVMKTNEALDRLHQDQNTATQNKGL